MNDNTSLARSAAQKMTTGSLMTLDEVAVRLAVSPMTVHRMPLTSIRLGRSLRFDPLDVAQLIAASREEAHGAPPMPPQISGPTTSGNRLCSVDESLTHETP